LDLETQFRLPARLPKRLYKAITRSTRRKA
jgi:hypothetical protein